MDNFATILMLLGLLIPLVAIIMLIISSVKRKPKKKSLIVLLIGILCFVIGVIIMPTEDPAVEEPPVNESISIGSIIKKGVLQYPASDDMFKYNIYDTYVEITEYIGSQNVSSITVPSEIENLPVYVVDFNVFDRCKVPTIIFEEGIYSIKSGFSGSLVSVTLPSTLDYVSSGTFRNCYKLENVVIPEGIDSIQFRTFEHCSSLKEITIPSTVTSIDTEVFAYCSSLEKVNLPDTLKSIGDRAFVMCKALKSLNIPDKVEELGEHVFQGTGLEYIEIPESVLEIGDGTFTACESLKEVKVYSNNFVAPVGLMFSQCNKDLVVYGEPASAIAKVCARENIYFKPF